MLKARKKTRVLYFEIDGVLLDYEEHPKPALLDGRLEAMLKSAKFDVLACVSGRSDMVAFSPLHPRSLALQQELIWQQVAALFPDKAYFLSKILLIKDTDNRCHYLDLKADWYYMDSWADKFFVEQHGEEQYQKELNHRILLPDLEDDGTMVLRFLEQKAAHSFFKK